MESSTRRPSASTNPVIDNWLRVKPMNCIAARPIASDSGMETMTTSDARNPSGSSVMSTRPSAIAKSRVSCESRCSTFFD